MQVVRPYPLLVGFPTPLSPRRTLTCTTKFVQLPVSAQDRFPQTLGHGSSIGRVAAAEPIALTQATPQKLPSVIPSDPEDLAVAAGVQRLVRCAPTSLGRGLVAKFPLDRQTIVSAPLENALIITDEPLNGISIFGDRCQAQWQAAHGPLPALLAEFLGGDARWDVRMTAWLLWVAGEKPDCPVWGRYVGTLPRLEEVTCLLNYGPTEAAELQLPDLVEEARAQHAWAQTVHRKYFDATSGELRQLRLASRLEDTLWAMSMVRTRTFSEEVEGEGLTLMVPYADLANHSFNQNASFGMSPDSTRFELRLLGPLGLGREATISYGEGKPNSEIIRDYGFVVPGNPNDRLPPVPGPHPLPALNGASLMEAIGFSGDWRLGEVAPQPEVEAAAAESPEGQLTLARQRCVLLSLRLCDGLPVQPASSSSVGNGGGLFRIWPDAANSENNRRASTSALLPQRLRDTAGAYAAERAAVAVIRESFQAILDSFATCIDTDEAMLMAQCSPLTPSLPHRLEAAVRCRLEAKRMVAECLAVLRQYDSWLADKEK